MNVSYLKAFGRWQYATICFVVVLVSSFSPLQHAQAQGALLQSGASSDEFSQINWISGPQKMNLGDFADIDLPAGYHLTDAHGARMILADINNPIPDDVVGVIAPVSGKWWALVEYSPKGYIKNADVTKMNTASVLKDVKNQINAKSGTPSVTALKWESQPAYDPAMHSLAWSIQVVTPSAKVLNQSVSLLGRHGVLQFTSVQAYPPADASSLKQLVASVASFKDGERYTDYQAGDKVADMGPAELISGVKPTSIASIFSFNGSAAIMIYSGLGLCLVLGIAGVVLMRKSSRRHSRSHSHSHAHAHAHAPVAAVNGSNGNGVSLALKNGGSNGHASNGNGNGNGAKHFHRNRRRRVFDYPKFYTNVMRELSLHSYGPGQSSHGSAQAQANGSANGSANGTANGHTNGANGTSITDAVKSEIVQLIATQKNLIQEQKCLLEQQTKLIQEKRWLIEEQSAFLKGQAGALDEQQFPLKFE
jgi:uncharacterized membrane-anchored protein